MMKTKQDNNVTNRISAVYANTENEFLRPIWLVVIYDWSTLKMNFQDNNVTDRTGAVYVENEIELSWPIEPVRSMRKTI